MDTQHAETDILASQHKESVRVLSALIEWTGGGGGLHAAELTPLFA